MSEYSITDETTSEVLELLARDQEELYAVLGFQLKGIDEPISEVFIKGRVELLRVDLVSKGKDFFQKILPALKQTICEDFRFCEKKESFINDVEKLVNTLLPIVIKAGITISGVLIPKATLILIVTLVIKYGLIKLCGC